MAKIDPTLVAILEKYGQDPKKACWEIHGTWVVLHKALEQIAQNAGVRFEQPTIIEANGGAGVASMLVQGYMPLPNDNPDTESDCVFEWSIGEASPANCTSVSAKYPWSMAEKRGKDRVILKLIGLHGLVYSEEEADDFKKQNQPGYLPTMKSFGAEADKDFPSQELSPIGADNVEDWPGWDETIRQLISQTPNKGALDMLYKDNSGSFAMYKEIEPESHDKLILQFAARKEQF